MDIDPNINPTGSATFPVVNAFDIGNNPVTVSYSAASSPAVLFSVDANTRMVTVINIGLGTTVITVTVRDNSGNVNTCPSFSIVGNQGTWI